MLHCNAVVTKVSKRLNQSMQSFSWRKGIPAASANGGRNRAMRCLSLRIDKVGTLRLLVICYHCCIATCLEQYAGASNQVLSKLYSCNGTMRVKGAKLHASQTRRCAVLGLRFRSVPICLVRKQDCFIPQDTSTRILKVSAVQAPFPVIMI